MLVFRVICSCYYRLEIVQGADKGSTLDKAVFLARNFRDTHMLTASISLVALIVLIGVKISKDRLRDRIKWLQYFPEILIVVVIGTGMPNWSNLLAATETIGL